jgi:carboxylate-amine ligase
MENKWRAARWGIRGLLIDFGTQREVPCTALLEELMEFIDDVVDELGTRDQIQSGVRAIVEDGTGAERQLAVYRATNDLRAVMDYVAAETEHGLAG